MNDSNSEVITDRKSTVLLKAINGATPVQIDTLWSILKYKEIGISTMLPFRDALPE